MHGRDNQMPVKGLLVSFHMTYAYQQSSSIFTKTLKDIFVCYNLF